MNDSAPSNPQPKFADFKLIKLDEKIAKLEEKEFQESLNRVKKEDFEE